MTDGVSKAAVEAVARAIVKARFYDPEPEMYGRDIAAFFAQLEPELLEETRYEARAALLAAAPFQRRDAIEACARIAEKERDGFLSPQYATGQPLSSLMERFACDQIARAIRASADLPQEGSV